jgi:hypothetical protein
MTGKTLNELAAVWGEFRRDVQKIHSGTLCFGKLRENPQVTYTIYPKIGKLSKIHGDHTGGLDAFFVGRPNVKDKLEHEGIGWGGFTRGVVTALSFTSLFHEGTPF